MFRENWLMPMVCAGALTLLSESAFALLSRTGEWFQAGRLLGLRMLYHALLAPLVVWLAGRVCRSLMRQRVEAA
jgi:hypothetical protein